MSRGGPRWLIATWVEMVRRGFENGAPAPEVVERNVGARIREVRAHVMQSRAAQSHNC